MNDLWDGIERRQARAEHVTPDDFYRLRRRVDDWDGRISMVETTAHQWNRDSETTRNQLSGWMADQEDRVSHWIEGIEKNVGHWMRDADSRFERHERREFIFAMLVAVNVFLITWNIIQNITR